MFPSVYSTEPVPKRTAAELISKPIHTCYQTCFINCINYTCLPPHPTDITSYTPK